MYGSDSVRNAGLSERTFHEGQDVAGDFVGIIDGDEIFGLGVAQGSGNIAAIAAKDFDDFRGNQGFEG